MKLYYREGELHKMDLRAEFEKANARYQQIVKAVTDLDNERAKLINEGVKLEGRITVLQEQLNEPVKPTEVA